MKNCWNCGATLKQESPKRKSRKELEKRVDALEQRSQLLDQAMTKAIERAELSLRAVRGTV